MKNKLVCFVIGMCILASLLCGCGPGPAPVVTEATRETEGAVSHSWEDNLLMEKPVVAIVESLEQYDRIRRIEFLDTLESAPDNARDVSLEGDGTVLGWFADGTIFIAGEGGVNGRECCAGLFKDMRQLEEVKFAGAFHTEQAKSMREMFFCCLNLCRVDADTLDTSQVTDMAMMFHATSIESLDLGTWDTSKVVTMKEMFFMNKDMTLIGTDQWETSQVKQWSQFMYPGQEADGKPWEELFT